MNSSRNNTLFFSAAGSIILDGTNHATATDSIGCIQFLKESEITAITIPNAENGDELITTLPAGTEIYGDISTVTIAAGGLVACHRK